ncbi:MAG: hypothetical protein Q4C61_09305 [Lachnospiraceae bacterium]|nr:hypothetical protein [Lachnospiraceae bacterium]
MKRKFAAVVLGLTLALTPVGAFAAENTEAAEQTEQPSSASKSEAEKETERFTGEVKTVEKDSMIIGPKEVQKDEGMGDDTEKSAVEGVDDTEAGEGDAQAESELPEFIREEKNVKITQDTVIYHVPDTEDGKLLMEEYSEHSDELSELERIALADIQEKDLVSVTLDEDGNAAMILVQFSENEDRELTPGLTEDGAAEANTEGGTEIVIE